MEDKPVTQEVETTKITTGVTGFGIGHFNLPQPMWVTYIFRTEFILSKAIMMVLGVSSIFTAEQVKESLIWLAAVDYLVWQVGKFFGVKKEDLEK